MSELKSVNIASWGFAIIALFLIIIGLEEVCLFIPDEKWYDWYIPGGELATIAAIFSLILTIYTFWNGDKKHGVLFGWMTFMFLGASVVSIKYYYLLSLITGRFGVFLGHPALVLGIVLAVFTLIFAVWAFTDKQVGKFYGIFFVLAAIFILLEAIGVFFVGSENIHGWIYISMPDNTLLLKGIAGLFALAAGILGFYLGLVKGVFMSIGKESAQELKTFNVRGLCGLIIAFTLVMFGLELVLQRVDYAIGFGTQFDNYSDLPSLFVAMGLIASVLMIFLAYWNGDKKNTLFMFTTLIFFTMIALFYTNSRESLSEIIAADMMNAFFVPALMTALFFVCIAAWYVFKSKKTRMYGMAVLMLAISLIFAGIIQFAGENIGLVFDFQLGAGLFAIIAGILTVAIGFANVTDNKKLMV